MLMIHVTICVSFGYHPANINLFKVIKKTLEKCVKYD